MWMRSPSASRSCPVSRPGGVHSPPRIVPLALRPCVPLCTTSLQNLVFLRKFQAAWDASFAVSACWAVINTALLLFDTIGRGYAAGHFMIQMSVKCQRIIPWPLPPRFAISTQRREGAKSQGIEFFFHLASLRLCAFALIPPTPGAEQRCQQRGKPGAKR